MSSRSLTFDIGGINVHSGLFKKDVYEIPYHAFLLSVVDNTRVLVWVNLGTHWPTAHQFKLDREHLVGGGHVNVESNKFVVFGTTHSYFTPPFWVKERCAELLFHTFQEKNLLPESVTEFGALEAEIKWDNYPFTIHPFWHDKKKPDFEEVSS